MFLKSASCSNKLLAAGMRDFYEQRAQLLLQAMAPRCRAGTKAFDNPIGNLSDFHIGHSRLIMPPWGRGVKLVKEYSARTG